MNTATVNQLVREVLREGPNPERLQALLVTTFEIADENPAWTFYVFALSDGPFANGEFRHNKAGGRALLSLMARETSPVAERALDLKPWGPVQSINISPRIPPEGADAYVYRVGSVRVSFQFTHSSRRLRSVALEWGNPR
jgi:hypothetical protein